MDKKKIVVITGASSGLGMEIARKVAARGWIPVLMARSIDKLEHLRNEIQNDYKTTAYSFQLDVQKMDDIKAVFQRVEEEAGPVDVLINNAGFGIFDYFKESKIEDIEGMFNTNVVGLMACTKAALPGMAQRKKGHIINIASQAGKFATVKGSVYAATKHAVLGFTNSLRMEVKEDGIFVTSVNPGPIKTNFFKIADQSGHYEKNVAKWMLDPSDIAAKIVAAIDRPVREINLPGWMEAGSKLYQLMPTLVERLGNKAFKQK